MCLMGEEEEAGWADGGGFLLDFWFLMGSLRIWFLIFDWIVDGIGMGFLGCLWDSLRVDENSEMVWGFFEDSLRIF